VNLSVRDLARIGGLLAAAFVLKLPAMGVPNIEPFTLIFFFIGFRYGTVWGAAVGALGELLYSTLNPFGPALPPVTLAQVIGMALAGLAGGGAARFDPGGVFTQTRRWGLVLTAVLITLVYDLLTNLAMVWTLGNLWAWLLAGIPFSALHIVSNCLLFALAFPALQKIVPRRQEEIRSYG
jgi:hypothetical protein